MDSRRIRRQDGACNLSILRCLVLNLLWRHPGRGRLKMKRYRGSLEHRFLLEILVASLLITLSLMI